MGIPQNTINKNTLSLSLSRIFHSLSTFSLTTMAANHFLSQQWELSHTGKWTTYLRSLSTPSPICLILHFHVLLLPFLFLHLHLLYVLLRLLCCFKLVFFLQIWFYFSNLVFFFLNLSK